VAVFRHDHVVPVPLDDGRTLPIEEPPHITGDGDCRCFPETRMQPGGAEVVVHHGLCHAAGIIEATHHLAAAVAHEDFGHGIAQAMTRAQARLHRHHLGFGIPIG
jgi:hypothetical protein